MSAWNQDSNLLSLPQIGPPIFETFEPMKLDVLKIVKHKKIGDATLKESLSTKFSKIQNFKYLNVEN